MKLSKLLILLLILPSLCCASEHQFKAAFQENIQQSFDRLTTELNQKIQKLKTKQKPLTYSKKPPTYIIVIDPGHGGKDSGAIGANGVKEKNIVLNIAKRLAKKINENPSMRAVLTRTKDNFVPLTERLKFARKYKADLFVAIHADAHYDDKAAGVSVYALSEKGATSVAARWLAQSENHSELDGVELNALQDHSPMLRSVLIDLAQTATTRDSLRLGNKILDALDSISTLHYARVEQAPFLVLKSPDIPSVLVETGFISNPREERRLQSASYQDEVARALQLGITQYLQKYMTANR